MTKNEIQFQDINKVKDIKPQQTENSPIVNDRTGVTKPKRIERNLDEIDMLPNIKISRRNGIQGNIIRVTSEYDAHGGEYLISCDADGGAFDVNLPDLSSNLCKVIYITETGGTNLVTVKDSGATTVAQVLNGTFNIVEVFWNGDYWEKPQ